MNKKIKILIICILISFILMFLIQIAYKRIKIGNNIDRSKEDLIEYILNISSYEANLEVIVNSNKTTNRYEIQQYYMEPNFFKQIVKYPENIKNLEIVYDGKVLAIKNTNLEISKIYKNFEYINTNKLWLNSFIESCKENKYIIEENNNEVIVKNNQNWALCINKETKLPISLKINDNNNNTKIYIQYKEIKVNSIKDSNIFAFITEDIKREV